MASKFESEQEFKEMFTFLTCNEYPASCDLPVGPLRNKMRRNFIKRSVRYSLSPCKAELFITRTHRGKAGGSITVQAIMDIDR